jgi:Uma2 family endonuclease
LYYFHLDIEFFGYGEATIETEADQNGRQPDISYCFHEKKPYPDLVIEVALTSGGVDKLGFYQQYGIQEVWVWANDALSVHVLGPDGYVASQKSGWFPDLNLAALVECLGIESTREARKTFLSHLSS